MAYLILEDDSKGPIYFDFDPGNEDSLCAMEDLLSRGDCKSADVRNRLAEACEQSMKKDTQPTRKKSLQTEITKRLRVLSGKMRCPAIKGNPFGAGPKPVLQWR